MFALHIKVIVWRGLQRGPYRRHGLGNIFSWNILIYRYTKSAVDRVTRWKEVAEVKSPSEQTTSLYILMTMPPGCRNSHFGMLQL